MLSHAVLGFRRCAASARTGSFCKSNAQPLKKATMKRSFKTSAYVKNSDNSEYSRILSEKINTALNQSAPGTQTSSDSERRINEAISSARREAVNNFSKQQQSGQQTITVKSPSRDSRR